MKLNKVVTIYNIYVKYFWLRKYLHVVEGFFKSWSKYVSASFGAQQPVTYPLDSEQS
jgi:hypothetical protein